MANTSSFSWSVFAIWVLLSTLLCSSDIPLLAFLFLWVDIWPKVLIVGFSWFCYFLLPLFAFTCNCGFSFIPSTGILAITVIVFTLPVFFPSSMFLSYCTSGLLTRRCFMWFIWTFLRWNMIVYYSCKPFQKKSDNNFFQSISISFRRLTKSAFK